MTTIYLDMDDVLVDFRLYATQVLKKKQKNEKWEQQEWEKLRDNQRLYRNLEKTPIADELVATCKKISREKNWSLKILTAVPKGNDVKWAFYDKVLWVLEHYPDIPVMFGPYSKDKHTHCKPGDILIDDRISNITEWIDAGGIGIHHLSDGKKTIEELLKL